MAYECRVEQDSVTAYGNRLTTFVLTYPRCVHAEFLTHRMLSRNSSSSRAVPVKRMIERVKEDPFVPEVWGKNRRGMQPLGEEVDDVKGCRWVWGHVRDHVVTWSSALSEKNVHKQWVNRLLEPFSWITVVTTATDWANFFALRCHPDAQQEIRKIAGMMRDCLGGSSPRRLSRGEWHLPFVAEKEYAFDLWVLKRLSLARCARVSYLSHDGEYDLVNDLRLANDLLTHEPRHASPAEHQATPDPQYWYKLSVRNQLVRENQGRHESWMDNVLYSGNFRGWVQYRKEIPGECVRELVCTEAEGGVTCSAKS